MYSLPKTIRHIPLALLLLSLALISCDTSDNLPVIHVDSQERLPDTALQKEQAQQDKDIRQAQDKIFYFGFDLRRSPQEDAAQYLPFLKYLEAATGYQFKLHFTPKSSTTVEELGQNKTQFAAMGASSFLDAQSMYGAISLVRGLNHQGKAVYQSVFVVKPNSRIRDISDFKGRGLAFGSRDSTQGHLIPRIMLTENGISLKDLSSYAYMGSHQNCAEAVVAGRFDICGMQDKLAEELAAGGYVKIIHRSRDYPSSGIVASGLLPAEVIARVRQALLDFDPQGKHRQNLYHWDKTEMPKGFVEAMEGDYVDLRQWSIRLGFMQDNHGPGPAQ
ncbi:phosphate/phosphite/phosphonate ABC transporter substrate-binding protein [Sulfuriflexus mobilis]|uniref:phosphate/phosphite/phosphonate ABC transporter substrate-binding protein n=1 Tax=Sulfuriflexus mobilis TaxID=1811807 RepID=UPI000F82F66F|nr:phosphate/phosphite/phosphonate ABC transporter substrate-binding protein [Sulfuriflexus mobilis]